MQIIALEWLYRQLKKKRIALLNAEKRPNCTQSEVRNLKKNIEILEYLIGLVTAKGEDA